MQVHKQLWWNRTANQTWKFSPVAKFPFTAFTDPVVATSCESVTNMSFNFENNKVIDLIDK